MGRSPDRLTHLRRLPNIPERRSLFHTRPRKPAAKDLTLFFVGQILQRPARLLDVGKIGIPDLILLKSGSLPQTSSISSRTIAIAFAM